MMIFNHRFLESECINFKTFAFLAVKLFIDPSEHHYTTQTSKVNNFLIDPPHRDANRSVFAVFVTFFY